MWITWCAVHSLLISRTAHNVANTLIGRYSGTYRASYILFSIVSLIPVLWYQFSLPQHLIFQPSLMFRLIQGALLIYGVLMFYLGAQVYDMRFFLGISQWRNWLNKKETGQVPFHTDDVLTYVRHPWYSGGIALIWGFGSITDVYLLTRIILTGYLVIGTLLEDKRLKTELGEQYSVYIRKVPMLLPWKGIVGSW